MIHEAPEHHVLLDIFEDTTPNPLDVEGVRVIHHPYTSPRMRAQASVFTIQSNP